MSKTVEIEKIVIRVGQKEIPLSLQEAKELQEILNKTFGSGDRTIYVDRPWIIERPYFPPYHYWGITYSANCLNLCSSSFDVNSVGSDTNIISNS